MTPLAERNFLSVSIPDDMPRGKEDVDYGSRTPFIISCQSPDERKEYPSYFRWLANVVNPQLAADGLPDIGHVTASSIIVKNHNDYPVFARIYVEERTRTLDETTFIDGNPRELIRRFDGQCCAVIKLVHNCPLKLQLIVAPADSSDEVSTHTLDIKPGRLTKGSQCITVPL